MLKKLTRNSWILPFTIVILLGTIMLISPKTYNDYVAPTFYIVAIFAAILLIIGLFKSNKNIEKH